MRGIVSVLAVVLDHLVLCLLLLLQVFLHCLLLLSLCFPLSASLGRSTIACLSQGSKTRSTQYRQHYENCKSFHGTSIDQNLPKRPCDQPFPNPNRAYDLTTTTAATLDYVGKGHGRWADPPQHCPTPAIPFGTHRARTTRPHYEIFGGTLTLGGCDRYSVVLLDAWNHRLESSFQGRPSCL